MAEPATHILRKSFRVPAPSDEAFVLFTPRGERAWAEGWDPVFPTPVDDDTRPGTVFEVSHGAVRSTWVVSRCERPRIIQYARVTPSRSAGLITVTCAPDDTGKATQVSVEYHLTALTPEGVAELSRFAAHYVAFITQWRSAIASLYRRADKAS